MEPEKRTAEETPFEDRDIADDFSSGPLAAAEDADDDDAILDDEDEDEEL